MEDHATTPLLDEYLQSLQGMKTAEINPFFYTRLKGRMQQRQIQSQHSFKPAWVVVTLSFFLMINIWMILHTKNITQETAETKSSVQVFAETYQLNSNANY